MPKRCAICRVPKPLDAFTKDARRLDGHRDECTVCRKARRKQLAEGAPRMRPHQVAGAAKYV